MRAAIYARVSTANNGQDPRVQTRELGEFCERRGWTLVASGDSIDSPDRSATYFEHSKPSTRWA